MAVKDNRPVNLDIGTIKLPITAYASILHRVSGVAIFVGVAILLALLDCSLESQESFNTVKDNLNNNFLLKLVVWATLCGFIYHTCAGVKHLIMDLGIGETLEGGQKGATLVFAIAPVLMLLAGVWVW